MLKSKTGGISEETQAQRIYEQTAAIQTALEESKAHWKIVAAHCTTYNRIFSNVPNITHDMCVYY
jgi:hypothetical protein